MPLFLPDSNVLIYAKMAGMPEHPAALTWLTDTVNDPNATVALCETTLLAFLRITTNSKAFANPLPLAEAGQFVSELLARPNVRLRHPTPDHFVKLAKLMQKQATGGNLVMDFHLAVLASTLGATLVTRDKDFLQLPFVKAVNPFTT